MQQHWEGYITALGNQKTPQTSMPSVAPYETSSYETGKTGFMDLIASKPEITAKPAIEIKIVTNLIAEPFRVFGIGFKTNIIKSIIKPTCSPETESTCVAPEY